MRVIPSNLKDVLIIEPDIHRDDRGFFVETYHEKRYAEAGIKDRFVQDNHSASVRDTIRGLHAQLKHPQAKLVRCIYGEVFDVAVDVRKGSPSFGRWFGVRLSAENGKQMYIPGGFVHGFAVLSDRAEVEYKCSDVYHADDQFTILWNDPEIGVGWPVDHPLLSAKDKAAKVLKDQYQLLPFF